MRVRRRPSTAAVRSEAASARRSKGLAQGGQGGLGGIGEEQAAGRALEEGGSYIVLEVLDLLGDRARGHRQLLRRAAEVEMAGGGFEQRAER